MKARFIPDCSVVQMDGKYGVLHTHKREKKPLFATDHQNGVVITSDTELHKLSGILPNSQWRT